MIIIMMIIIINDNNDDDERLKEKNLTNKSVHDSRELILKAVTAAS